MSTFDHWHPMLASKKLRRKPVAVRLAGKEIALFRTRSGAVGALDDVCPHRRMRLSLGTVIGEELQCKYHGWTFDCAGNGKSPGTPAMHACASSFDACEKYGYIWVKSKQSTPILPAFDVEGWFWMCNAEHVVEAPLELALDNFTEIEHTPLTHKLFGFELDQMKNVVARYESTDDSTTFRGWGPAKKINFGMRAILGIGKNYLFNDVWTTYFSPVYSVFNHFWTDPSTGAEAKVKWRVYVFFVPAGDKTTHLVSFTYAKSAWPIPPHGGLLPFRGFTRRQVDREIQADVNLIQGLASHETGLRGMKLSRFDRTLGMNRDRIERIYRGNADSPSAEREFESAAAE